MWKAGQSSRVGVKMGKAGSSCILLASGEGPGALLTRHGCCNGARAAPRVTEGGTGQHTGLKAFKAAAQGGEELGARGCGGACGLSSLSSKLLLKP